MMINISKKKPTNRSALAQAVIQAKESTIKKIKNSKLPKGNALDVAKAAAFMAIKNTPYLIPMCHPVKVTHSEIKYKFVKKSITITCLAEGFDKTGFEMEALTGASVCALTIYDMAKAVDKAIKVSEVKLLKKTGGKSGMYVCTH